MEEQTLCSLCKKVISPEDIYCNNCGYPENGTDEVKGKYDLKIKLKKNVVDGAHKKLKNLKTMLFIIAGLNFVIGMYLITDDFTFTDGLVSLIASLVYLCCVAWVNKQPLTGVLAAFIFWILTQLSVLLVDPLLIFQGIILKIIFISIFVKGIASAKDAQKYTNELKEMNAI
jgi:hypothetical protein